MTHGSLVFRSKQRTHYIIYIHIYQLHSIALSYHILIILQLFIKLTLHFTTFMSSHKISGLLKQRHWDCRWGAKSLGICKTLGALALSSHVSYRKVASVWLMAATLAFSWFFHVFCCFYSAQQHAIPSMISTHVFHPVGTERSASVSAGSWRIRWITRRLGHLKTYVHLSQPGTGNHVFFIFSFFFILIIIFLAWKLSFPFYPR